jgi:hypothetical protein
LGRRRKGRKGKEKKETGHGVAMGSLKFHPDPPCPTLLRPAGGQPAAVIYLFGHHTPHAYGGEEGIGLRLTQIRDCEKAFNVDFSQISLNENQTGFLEETAGDREEHCVSLSTLWFIF